MGALRIVLPLSTSKLATAVGLTHKIPFLDSHCPTSASRCPTAAPRYTSFSSPPSLLWTRTSFAVAAPAVLPPRLPTRRWRLPLVKQLLHRHCPEALPRWVLLKASAGRRILHSAHSASFIDARSLLAPSPARPCQARNVRMKASL